MALNDRQKRFCEEYVKDSNGSRAARDAGYSEKTANEQAVRLLANINIQQYIRELQGEISERNNITVDWYISELQTNVEMARWKGQMSASNGALKQIAEVVRLIPEDGEGGDNKQPIINIFPASGK